MVDFVIGGSSADEINSVAALCVLGLALAIAVGCLLDRLCAEATDRRVAVNDDLVEASTPSQPSGRPPTSGLLLLLGSYVLLIPGLYSCLFSFNIMLDFGLIKLGVSPVRGAGIDKAPPFTESMMGLVQVLKESHAELGAHAVMFYAIGIPVAKLVLLVLGQLLRPWSPKVSGYITHFVQAISKWACPDMFAYILLVHLVRGMNHPNMLRSMMQLDIGFTCFTLFCVGSTFASLTLHTNEEASEKSSSSWLRFPRWFSGEPLMLVVVLLFVGFVFTFHKGLTEPVMALRIETQVLFKPKGPIPESVMGIPTRPIIAQLRIAEKAKADISIATAMSEMREWSAGGEVNSAIGLLMIGGFVVALTSVHMLLLLVSAILMRCGHRPMYLLNISPIMRRLAMLDVLTMGVVVLVLCMHMYRSEGIVVTHGHALYFLAASEALHYLTYFIVTGATEMLEDAGKYSAMGEGEVQAVELGEQGGAYQPLDMLQGVNGRTISPARPSRETPDGI